MEFNLADLYEAVADAVPERLALVAGERRLTYAQLDERANRLAHHLADAGIGVGDHVGVLAYNCAEWIEAMLATYKIRAVPINVNFRYVEDELRYLFDNADLVGLLLQRQFCPRVAAVAPDAPLLRHFVVVEDGATDDSSSLGAVEYENALAAASPDRDFPPRSADDHYVLYTGGTTGMPKGVVWRHEDIFFAAFGGGSFAGALLERPEDIVPQVRERTPQVSLTVAPMMHGGGQWVSFIGFFSGDTVVLYTGHRYDPDEILRLVERERVTTIGAVVGDAMVRPLAEALAASPDKYDTSSLTMIGSGGAILSPAVKEQLRAQLPNVLVLDSFGASETGYTGTVMDFDGAAAGPRFTVGDRATVVDDDGRPLAPGSGVVGRLARRGHVPLGYHKDPERSATIFVEIDGERWVVPGDAAVVDADGTITVLGRGSVCINTGGEKVFPEEVEAVLKAHPDVLDAVVVGVPDERWVERVAVVVQPRPGRTVTLKDLDAHCRRHLAGYKVPRQLHVVDEIVRTPAAKPDYRWAKAVATA